MEGLFSLLADNNLFILFAIILFGVFLGTFVFRGFSFGPAGIFFVALLFGHFGFKLPREIMDIGLALFVYAVGIQAGPKFFEMFKKDGRWFVALALVMAFSGAFMTLALAWVLALPIDLASGMFTGALTNTRAFAAASDLIEKMRYGEKSVVAAGYGIAYPFSILGTVLFVQLIPLLLRKKPKDEEAVWIAAARAEHPGLAVKNFIVENPACFGKALGEIHPHDIALVNISRIQHNGAEDVSRPETIVSEGDILTAVGPEKDLEKLRLIFGPETAADFLNKNIATQDIEITSPFFAKHSIGNLRIWHEFHVTVTRIKRQEFEIAPFGGAVLEAGDIVHVVGEKEDVEKFSKQAGVKDAHANDTSLLPLLLGLVLGIGLGTLPLPFFPGSSIALGTASGSLIAGLIISHMKKKGKLEMHVPAAALNIIRELGLMLFLSGAGLVAGSRVGSVFAEYGAVVVIAGAMITLSSLFAGLFFMRFAKSGALSAMSSISAGMTNTAALAFVRRETSTDLAPIIYASIYPFSLISKILLVQLLIYLLSLLPQVGL